MLTLCDLPTDLLRLVLETACELRDFWLVPLACCNKALRHLSARVFLLRAHLRSFEWAHIDSAGDGATLCEFAAALDWPLAKMLTSVRRWNTSVEVPSGRAARALVKQGAVPALLQIVRRVLSGPLATQAAATQLARLSQWEPTLVGKRAAATDAVHRIFARLSRELRREWRKRDTLGDSVGLVQELTRYNRDLATLFVSHFHPCCTRQDMELVDALTSGGQHVVLQGAFYHWGDVFEPPR